MINNTERPPGNFKEGREGGAYCYKVMSGG